MLSVSHLISHRFRGFAPLENTVEGLLSALDWGVEVVEFDVRIAKCGTPMVYHDEHAMSASGDQKLCEVIAMDYTRVGGRFATMPALDRLLEQAAEHSNPARLLIDIKDAGFEEVIRSLVRAHGLADRVVYVSWLPEVLYAMHALEPSAPLCFSHWAASPSLAARAVHTVHESLDGHVSRESHTPLGERSGWWMRKPLQGELFDILASVGGYVCIPRPHLTSGIADHYRNHGIGITVFSYVDYAPAKSDFEDHGLALLFSDSKRLFEAAQASGTEGAFGTVASPSRPGMA